MDVEPGGIPRTIETPITEDRLWIARPVCGLLPPPKGMSVVDETQRQDHYDDSI
jgi:hypothetical protein